MICPNCGAEYADWAHKCPYCGSVNEAVDEELYLKHMEELRQRLDHVDEEAEEAYKSSVSSSVKKMLRIAVIIAAAALVIVLIFVLKGKIQDRMEAKSEQKEYEWQQEEFPKLDALYEAGDYDGVIDEAYEAAKENGYSVWGWSHYYFVFEFYENYELMEGMTDLYGTDELDSLMLADGMYGAIYLYCYASDAYLDRLITSNNANGGQYGISEEEREIILTYREEAGRVLHDTLGFSDEEIEALYDEALDDDWLKFSVFSDRAEEMLEKS